VCPSGGWGEGVRALSSNHQQFENSIIIIIGGGLFEFVCFVFDTHKKIMIANFGYFIVTILLFSSFFAVRSFRSFFLYISVFFFTFCVIIAVVF
jgi:hypothetical protein